MSPEGDGTQDAKDALANLDIVCECAKQEQAWNSTRNLMMLCGNAGTCSAVALYTATFDVVRSRRLKLIGLTRNEAQDRKTELDSSFHHFKFQHKKRTRKNKGAALSLHSMIRAMEHSSGIASRGSGMLQFSRNRLNELLGKLKTRAKQVLPQLATEARVSNSKTRGIFEYFSTSRLNFKNGIVKNIGKHAESKKDQLIAGNDFFKKLREAITKDLPLPPIPIETSE